MYKQQSYDTPTEEFFQPSEGWFTSDPEFVKITMDHLLNKKLVPKETLEKWDEWSKNQKKTSKKKNNYTICKALTDALDELLNNIRIMDKPFTNFSTKIVDNQAVKIDFNKKDYIDIFLDININPEKYKDKTFEYIIFKDYLQTGNQYVFDISFQDGESTKQSKETKPIFGTKSFIHKEIKKQRILISFEKIYIYQFRDTNNETVFDTDKPSLHLAMKWLELKGKNMDEVCTVYKTKADEAQEELNTIKSELYIEENDEENEQPKPIEKIKEPIEKIKDLKRAQTQLNTKQTELEATKQYFLLQTKHINKEKNELEVTLVGVREQLKSADEKTEEVTEALNLIKKILDKRNKIITENEENKKKENQNIEQKLIALMPDAVVKEIEKQRREDDKNLAEKLLAEKRKSKIALEKRKAKRANKKKNANKQPDKPSEKTKEELEQELAALKKQLEKAKATEV